MSARFLRFGIAVAAVLSLSAAGYAQEELRLKELKVADETHVPGEVLVKFKSGVAEGRIAGLIARYRTTLLYVSPLAGFRRLRIPAETTVEEMVARLAQDPEVEYAEPNFIAHAFWQPNDQFYGYQWHLDNPQHTGGIQAEKAWDKATGVGVIVAVVDTGVAYEDYTQGSGFLAKRYYQAPDLSQTRFVPGYDFINNDAHPNDDNGHGTHVTGTIAQSTNNGLGTAGVAYDCSIMPVKVLNSQGSGTYAQVADGIRFAADRGADVINLSLGGSSASTTLRDALAYAHGKGVTLSCASGNNGSATTISYPAAYDEYCIAVGATRYDETVAYYSNRGASLDLVAPGGDVTVDQNGDGYGDGVLQQTFGSTTNDWAYFFYQGTSMAAPHVSGVAALIISHNVASGPDEVREVLQATAKDKGPAGWDPQHGHGLVDGAAALAYSTTPNNPPIALVGGPYSGTEDVAVAFNGSASYDPEGDTLTFAWDFGDGATAAGAQPSHSYAAGGTYTVTLVVSDGAADSAPSSTTAQIAEVNDPPVAKAGPDRSAAVGEVVTFDGSASYDSEGPIASYSWDFGDGSSASGVSPTHAYASAGAYTVTLTVADAGNLKGTDTLIVSVTDAPAALEVFSDDFENADWSGSWTQDAQNDWFRSSQRSVGGQYSAEVDGFAKDAQLLSKAIDLQGRANATITFSWYIERALDGSEYLAFDVSTDGGAVWVERARLRGNSDPEDVWRNEQIELSGVNNLMLRFRGKMSSPLEDANVDFVKVMAH